ncbi:hypothetical protein [Salinimicrobium flavum]|uniref:Outer membrane protein beta-barrel domain-containing protein n=1 Tax=Salinimicrobium flavum TaxID=1737065 RepID=A0ABW5IUH6_9FLAO
MKNTLLILLAIFGLTRVQAQFISEEAIDVSIGYGLSVPYEEVGFYGSGFYAQGEYVLGINEWVDLRPYAGYIGTKMNENFGGSIKPEDKATVNAFLFGGKARFTLPVPWIAPYLELGIGGSFGSFETVTDNMKFEESGAFLHIPFSIGLALGRSHNVSIELTWYFHTSPEQYAGVAAIGIAFPVGYY